MPLPGNEGNFLRINKQRKSNEAIYDVRYSRISGGIRGSSEKNRPFGENQLILLGDYIDYGPDGRAVLEKVRALQEKYGSEKVIALMGNHEKHCWTGWKNMQMSTGISAVWSNIAAGNGWHRMQMETMKRCTAF